MSEFVSELHLADGTTEGLRQLRKSQEIHNIGINSRVVDGYSI